MVDLGSITVGPLDRKVLVGPFSLNEGDDTLWVNITQISPQQEWNYSYGLVWWESIDGRQLGTQKVYGTQLGEIFRFGVGRAPLERDGSIYFAPRAYNRRWISIENPPLWTLNFAAESGVTSGGGLLNSISNSLVRSIDGAGLRFVDTALDLVQVDFT